MKPGVCLGKQTDCAHAPAAEPVDLGPIVTCDLPESPADGSITWSAHLGTIGCPEGECIPVISEITVGRDGSVWARSALFLPTSFAALASPVGAALSRLDPDGTPTFSVVTDFRSPIAGAAPGTSGMRVDSQGNLWLVAAMPDRPGLELRRYGPTGRLVTTRPLVDLARSGKGAIDADGSLTLVYRYEPSGAPDGGSKDPLHAPLSTDVARFDTDGVPIWNQTLSALLWPDNYDGQLEAPGPTDTAVAHLIAADVGPARAVMASLDRDGNVAWLRTHEDATFSTLLASPDGSFASVYGETFPQGSPQYLTRTGAEGTAIWSNVFGTSDAFGLSLVGSDSEGRTWGTKDGLEGFSVKAISADGTRCGWWGLTTESCMMNGDETDCSGVLLYPATNGDVYFGTAGQVGLAHFGGLP